MRATRRSVLIGGLASAAMGPSIISARAAPAVGRTVRAVMHADLRVFDPIWTTATITSYHGAMVYDTLFGQDEQGRPQPQMVGKWGTSDDKLTYTFTLRDGLKFSDGSPVTAADCVASIRRWQVRDGAGTHMFRRVKDTPVVDDKTFQIVLSERYGLVIEALSKISSSQCFVMRKKEAETDPNQQVRTIIGSGPFLYNADESRPGNRYVYDPSPSYVPRSEPASGMAGGKVVKIDRAIFENISDEQTALSALQAGEVDFCEAPPQDMLADLEKDSNLTVDIINTTGRVLVMRMNFLQPPFDNVEARRAMLYVVDQEAIMQAIFGQSKAWRKCGAYFSCGNPMENDENTEWFKTGPNSKKAAELFKKAGYDGRPVVVLQATDNTFANPAAMLTAQGLRQAGVNVDLAPMDWGAVVTRRASKKPISEGGWNTFFTASFGSELVDPIAFGAHAATGEKGWFGWPKDDLQEQLRDRWATAETPEQRKELAREMQRNAWNYVPQVYCGQFYPRSVWRKNLTGVLKIPQIVAFWNMEKKN